MELLRSLDAKPLLIAHRGFSSNYPENTRLAFDKALIENVDGIEMDLQFSSDSTAVIFHDKTLYKSGIGRKRIKHLDILSLKKLDIGSWFDSQYAYLRLMKLNEVIKRYAQKTHLFWEIKSFGYTTRQDVNQVLSIIRKFHLTSRITLLSFDLQLILYCKKQNPSLNSLYILRKKTHNISLFMKEIRPLNGICINRKKLTPAFAKFIHRQRKVLCVYSCNTKKQIISAINYKCDVIISDDPALARREIDEIWNQQ